MTEEVKNPERKQFFRESLDALKAGVSLHIDRSLAKRLDGPLRPPGALDEVEFLATCTRCEACVTACPYQAIQILPQSSGLAAKTPFIDPQIQPCFLCPDTPCISACEPRALVEVNPLEIHMGRAFVDEKHCLTYKDRVCTLCYDACPYPERAIVIDSDFHPQVLDACVGCGQCQYHCPTAPVSIESLSPVRIRKRELIDWP